MMKILLELDERQELFLVNVIVDAARLAWEASVDGDLDPCPIHGPQNAEFWNEELAAAEGVLAQLPGGAMALYRSVCAQKDEHEGADGAE